jgi:hypothetical protein
MSTTQRQAEPQNGVKPWGVFACKYHLSIKIQAKKRPWGRWRSKTFGAGGGGWCSTGRGAEKPTQASGSEGIG